MKISALTASDLELRRCFSANCFFVWSLPWCALGAACLLCFRSERLSGEASLLALLALTCVAAGSALVVGPIVATRSWLSYRQLSALEMEEVARLAAGSSSVRIYVDQVAAQQRQLVGFELEMLKRMHG